MYPQGSHQHNVKIVIREEALFFIIVSRTRITKETLNAIEKTLYKYSLKWCDLTLESFCNNTKHNLAFRIEPLVEKKDVEQFSLLPFIFWVVIVSKRYIVLIITICYILHELGHILSLLTLGIQFQPVLFPMVFDIIHIFGISRADTGDSLTEFYLTVLSPLIMQTIFLVLTKKEKEYYLVYLMSYGDIITFTQRMVLIIFQTIFFYDLGG